MKSLDQEHKGKTWYKKEGTDPILGDKGEKIEGATPGNTEGQGEVREGNRSEAKADRGERGLEECGQARDGCYLFHPKE